MKESEKTLTDRDIRTLDPSVPTIDVPDLEKISEYINGAIAAGESEAKVPISVLKSFGVTLQRLLSSDKAEAAQLKGVDAKYDYDSNDGSPKIAS